MAYNPEAYRKATNKLLGISTQQDEPNAPQGEIVETGQSIAADAAAAINEDLPATQGENAGGGGEYEATSDAQEAAAAAIEDLDVTARNPDEVDDNPGVDPAIQAENEKGALAPFKEAVERTADNPDAFLNQQAQSIRASALYRNYIYTPAEKVAKAREMGKALGMPAGVILEDDTTYKNTQHAYDYYKKSMAVTGNETLSLKSMMTQFPELHGMHDMDEEELSLVLHDMENVHRIHGLINNALVGWEQGKKKAEHDLKNYKVYEGKANKEQRDQAYLSHQELSNPLNRLEPPEFLDSPLESAVGGAAQSLSMMLEGYKGNVVGGITSALMATYAAVVATSITSGAGNSGNLADAWAFGWKLGAMVGGIGSLSKLTIGESYADKKYQTTKSGMPLYNDNEIKEAATIEGLVNASVENWSNQNIAGLAMPKTALAEKAFKETMAVNILQANASRNLSAQAKSFVKEGASDFGKALLGEITEEGEQSLTSDLSNNYLVYKTGKGEYVSRFDMARNAFNSSVDAIPTASFLVGTSGAGGAALGMNSISRQMFRAYNNGQYTEQSQQTIVGMNLLANLQAAVADSKLKDLAPDVQKKIIHKQAENTDFKVVYIDTESALQKENGRDSLQKVADAAGYDSDTLQTAIEQGNLIVPLEVYAQSEADPDLLSSVSFSKTAPSIEKMKRDVKEAFAHQQEMMKAAIDRQNKILDQFTAEYFPNDKEGSEMAAAAIYENAENPAQGLKAIEKRLTDERDAILQPAMDAITKGGDEEWRKNFKEIFGKSPSKKVLMDMAEDLIYGSANAPQIDGWSIDPETSTDARDKLAAISHRLAIIDRTKEKISTMTKAEIKLTEGMTPEAFSTYRTLFSELAKGPGTSSRAARINAILFARRADNFARVISEKTGRNYTAKDYYQERFALGFDGQQQADAFNQILGENGAAELDRQEEVTTRLDNLAVARQMEEAGKDAQAIKLATGWERGADKLWRYEIPDNIGLHLGYADRWNESNHPELSRYQELLDKSIEQLEKYDTEYSDIWTEEDEAESDAIFEKWKDEFQIQSDLSNAVVNGKEIPLRQAIWAPELFKAYPSLEFDTFVVKDLPYGVKAYVEHPSVLSMTTQKRLVVAQKEIYSKDLKSIILHEIQHIIQDEEGFARGSSPEEFATADNAAARELAVGELQDKINRQATSIAKGLLNGAGIEDDSLIPNIVETLTTTDKTLKEIVSDFNLPEGALWDMPQELYNRLLVSSKKKLAKTKDKYNPVNQYTRTIGEVESRNVQSRMDMSWEERRKTLLKDTEDVAREDQIFLRDGGAAFAVNVPIDENTEYPVIDLSQYTDNIGDTADTEQSRNKVMNYIIDNLVGTNVTAYSKDLMLRYGFDFGDTGNIHHVAYAHSTYGKNGKRSRLARNVTLSNLSDILSNSVLVEVNTKPKNKDGAHADKDHQANRIASVRAVMPVKLPNKRIMSMVITADTENPILERHAIDVSLYEIGIRKPGPRITAMQSEPGTMNIADILWNVKDTQGNYYVDRSTGKLNYADKLFFNNEQTDAETYFQSAWHGTPHDFDTFDLGAIGTGEGAQAHGWGLYFAADKKISEEYRERLTRGKLKSLEFSINGVEYQASTLTNDLKRKDGAPLSDIENLFKHLFLSGSIESYLRENPSGENPKEAIRNFLDGLKADKKNGYRSGDKYLENAPKTVGECLSTPKHPADAELIERVINIYKEAADYYGHIQDHTDECVDRIETGLKELLGERKANSYIKKMYKKGVSVTSIALWYQESRDISAAIDFLKDIDSMEVSASFVKPGTLFEVDIPEDSVMLDEKLTYEEQPEAVQMALWDLTTASFPGDEFGGKTGLEIYEILSNRYGGDKAASLALNDAGIKGIKYDGYIDGTCYVVFDDKAISVINKYNQEANSKIKGSFSPLSNGQRLIQLFSTADESTFLHEMGHLFLTDLEDLAKIDEVSAKELAAVREWAAWKKGDYRKYQGTPWSKEFSDIEKSIIAAEESGDTITAEAQKRRWMQERFARGFEIYLKDGKAPAKGLQAVFRKFAAFLRQIYTAFVSDGARASADVEAIMARMIATDEEIEAMAMDDQFKDIEKAGGEKLLNETERETYERWLNEAKEEAKEKLQKVVMADLTEKKRQEMLKLKEEERAKEYERLEQEPIYLARAIIDKLGGSVEEAMPVILDHCFPDRESFEAADKAAPSIEEAVQRHIENWQRDYDEQNRKEISEEEVREAMETSVYHRKAKAMESAALSRKLDAKRKITGKVDKAVQNINDAIDSMPEDTDLKVDKYTKRVKTLIQKVNELRFATRWNANDFKYLEGMLKATTPAEMKELLADFVKNMQQQKLNINDVEKANEGRLKMYAEMARKAAKDKPIYNATNSGEYRRNQRKAESRVLQMIKAGRFELALQQTQQAALSAAMANAAEEAKEEVDKIIARINRQLNARTVKLPAKERYWHKHIAYLLGIGLNDANKPVLPEGQQLGTLQDLLNSYKDRLDLTEDYNADEVLEFITGTAAQQSYVALTVDQLRQAEQLLNIIYKCGKDEFELKTVKGKTIASVVDDILKDEVALAREMHIKKRRIQDNIGGLGYNGWLDKIPTVGDILVKAGQEYIVESLKPEKVIELLGKTAYKYIFGTFDEAANREADMMAQATMDVQNLLKDYSHQERRDWKKRTYKLQLPGEEVELTKENIICMALNLGTEINRQRLIGGLLGPDHDKENGKDTQNLLNFIEDNMTKKDWLLVQSVWDYLHTYWEDTVRVEQDLNGMQLKAQAPVPFPVTVDGEVLNMAGGYYPIVYNPDKNDRSSVQAQDDVAKQMGGSAKVLGTGRSHTKSRTEADVFRELQLTFDTIPKHLNQVIHNITTRIAARDVYRLLNHKELSQHITDRLGNPALDMLRKWALDAWTQLPEKSMASNILERTLGALRRNSTFAIMAYRIWPVVENLSNYAVLADKLGNVNALSALSDFYGSINEHKELLNKSVMMRNRLNNLDRDIRSTPGLFNADHPVMEMIREHGYDLMTYSDLMFSAPLWCRAYKDVFQGTLEEVNNENIANKEKVQEAQNNLDKLRGQRIQTDEDIKEWYAERRNRANAGQVGWQPGTSRFAVMGHQEFTEQLEELKNRKDELGLKIWEAEAEFGRAIELKILDDAEVVREAEHRAAMKADAVIRDAFGSGRTVDLPAVQRRYSELAKAMTTFYSFFNTVFNSIYFSYIQSRHGNRPAPNAGTWEHVKQWAPLARTVMYRIFLLSAIGSVLKMATKTDGDDDRDKYRKVMKDGKEVKEEIPWLQRFLKVFAKNSLSTATGSLYGARDIANVIMNRAFDGTDFGRGINIVSTPLRSVEEIMRTINLIAEKSERDAKIAEKEAKDLAAYRKMTPKQKKKWREEQKYKQPVKRITYTEIFRHAANALAGFTATKTGVSSTVIDSVTGTMQYLLDTDNRYDATWRNIIWSAIFDKKPVERKPPEKPEKTKQKKPRQ